MVLYKVEKKLSSKPTKPNDHIWLYGYMGVINR